MAVKDNLNSARGGIDLYGKGTTSNSWTVNIKRNKPTLKITGCGYEGASPNNKLTLRILGASDDNTTPYPVAAGKWLPTIADVTLSATMETQEIDVSAYPRLVLYVIYNSGTSNDNTALYFHIKN